MCDDMIEMLLFWFVMGHLLLLGLAGVLLVGVLLFLGWYGTALIVAGVLGVLAWGICRLVRWRTEQDRW